MHQCACPGMMAQLLSESVVSSSFMFYHLDDVREQMRSELKRVREQHFRCKQIAMYHQWPRYSNISSKKSPSLFVVSSQGLQASLSRSRDYCCLGSCFRASLIPHLSLFWRKHVVSCWLYLAIYFTCNIYE